MPAVTICPRYNASGKQIPEDEPTLLVLSPITVRQVTADYHAEELPSRKHKSGDPGWQSKLLELIEAKFGDLPADDFGLRKLCEIRQEEHRGQAMYLGLGGMQSKNRQCAANRVVWPCSRLIGKSQVVPVPKIPRCPVDKNTATAMFRRLKREGHDELIEQVKSGEKSVNAAAIEAGFHKKQISIPVGDVSAAAKRLRKHFSADQLAELSKAISE